MFAHEWSKTQVLVEADVYRKTAQLHAVLEGLLKGQSLTVPNHPGRDVQIYFIRDLPPKKGLSTREGQARLIHDLASIELQAMELGVRTLAEFPDAPREFREQLAEVTAEEGEHLKLCLEALEDLEMPWGSFPTHVGLWQSTDRDDSLLDRIVIVHRYLEGSGLDATDKILRRLSGIHAPVATKPIQIICRDEVGHVQFGSRWYHKILKEEKGDPDQDFAERLNRLFRKIPRRLEPIHHERRRQAGFTEKEIQTLEEIRERWLNGHETDRIHPHK
jgi:uncharacterized ferritin-like protein (DUF455 family)